MFNWGIHSTYGIGPFPVSLGVALPFILLALALKGMVLWLTAQRQQTAWFVFFLIVNTLGIGELIYLLVTNGFRELRKQK